MIYLDNAATTALDPLVLEAMLPYMTTVVGNPSSIHGHGRAVRSAVEKARKTVASLLNCATSEIFFTSGGTEADNTAIISTVQSQGIKRVISTKIEHHAVLHTLEFLAASGAIELLFLELDAQGGVALNQLEGLLKDQPRTLVSLMHANNEIGNLIDLQKVSAICNEHNAIFHSDTVQTMGQLKHNLEELKMDFVVGAGHKFHGPKGIGFLYKNGRTAIKPYVHGGAQERNMRGGTENVYGIIGLAKALELAYESLDQDQAHILALKKYLKKGLLEAIPDTHFNGLSGVENQSIAKVLSVSFPSIEAADMLLFNLDIHKISASGGSACTSGTNIGSHVLEGIGTDQQRPAIRFSFSKYNTFQELDQVIGVMQKLILTKA
jgi:cysteine desulfurase